MPVSAHKLYMDFPGVHKGNGRLGEEHPGFAHAEKLFTDIYDQLGITGRSCIRAYHRFFGMKMDEYMACRDGEAAVTDHKCAYATEHNGQVLWFNPYVERVRSYGNDVWDNNAPLDENLLNVVKNITPYKKSDVLVVLPDRSPYYPGKSVSVIIARPGITLPESDLWIRKVAE